MLPTSWMGPYLLCLFVAVIFHMQAGGYAEILVLSEMWNAAAAPTLPWNFERVSDKSVLQRVRRRRCQNFGFTFHWNKLSDYFFNPLEFLSTMSTFCTATLYLFVMCACLWLPFILDIACQSTRHFAYSHRKKQFCRRRLPYHLVMRCRRRVSHRPPRLSGSRRHPSRKSWSYARWRRRRYAAQFEQKLWCSYYEAELKSFASGEPPTFSLDLPFSEDILEQFCNGKDADGNYLRDFLGLMNLFKGFEEEDHEKNAQDTINRMNSHRTSMLLQAAGSDVPKLQKHFKLSLSFGIMVPLMA